ncbi:MAG: AzlC family ABC transporter permease [Anaerolineae bacterium]|nr:AzlC family ABC transporter permease [Anaerolineae bacterium]
MTEPATRRAEFWAGVKDTFPLVVGAIPFGLIFGAVAVTSGLSPAAAQGMSLFVFAGSAQFIGAGLVAGGASIPVIVLTTFIVNLRHALYSASLAPHMKHLPQRWLIPLGFWLTDETFAVVIQRYNQPDDSPYKHWYFFGSDLFMYVNWNICTLIGLLAGRAIPDASKLGLDFAMVVTFIGIVVPLVKNRPMLVSVIVAGLTAVITNPLPNKLGLMIAALAGVAAGFISESRYPPVKVSVKSEDREMVRQS